MTPTRRSFLQAASGATLLAQAPRISPQPWYLRAVRWGQTNITERDPEHYDIPFWRDYWKRTAVQGVIINAGGIVAYYPSKFPLHHRAQFLNDRDLYGDLARAAHEDGLVVMARMDSNRTGADFFQAHPDWFARMADGQPYRAADKYVTCINSPYYDEYLPEVLREIIDRSHPEGVTDNSWAGLGRNSICYCENCRKRFRDKAGHAIPPRVDWDDDAYRQWILWNYARRTELWEFNNRVTQAAGGRDCIWSGMNSGSVSAQASSFRDLREICHRAHIVMLDHQRRDNDTGFQQNGDTGKRVHGLLGWDKLAPESMAMYQAAPASFRIAAKPAAEARMWMIAGMAGGIQPWWHHIGAAPEDRRAFRTAEPVMKWHKANEPFLMNRRPVATVGLVWSQRNTDFYGRDRAGDLVDAPYQGFAQALIRARIPYLPVHIDDLEQQAAGLAVLVLANVGAVSDAQSAAIRRFVERGGGLVATGQSTLFNEWGDPRPDFALADLFGAHTTAPAERPRFTNQHTYLRLHTKLPGFDDTDVIAYGGTLPNLRVDPAAEVPLTLVPEFPVYPPETAWMRETDSKTPALIRKGRVAYLPADIDRRYFRDLLPDHGTLLAHLTRWASREPIPLQVEGAGLIDCHLYQQQSRMILHLVNLTSAGTWRAPIDELIRVGPFRVRVKFAAAKARGLVSSAAIPMKVNAGWTEFEVKSIEDHEVVVLEGASK